MNSSDESFFISETYSSRRGKSADGLSVEIGESVSSRPLQAFAANQGTTPNLCRPSTGRPPEMQ